MKTKDCDSTKMCCLIFLTDSFISSDSQGCYNSVSDDVDLLLVFQLSSGRGNASVVKMVSQVTKLVYHLAAIARRSLSSYLYSSCSFFMHFPPDTCSWPLPPPRDGTCRAEPAEDSLLLFLGLVSAGLLSWFTSPGLWRVVKQLVENEQGQQPLMGKGKGNLLLPLWGTNWSEWN